MKKYRFLLIFVLIASFVVGCGSNSEKETTKKTSKDKTKETTKKKEKVKLLHDNQYYIDLATNLDWFHYFVGGFTGTLYDDPSVTYYFDDVKSMSNSQIDYYIDWYFTYHMSDYNVEQYDTSPGEALKIPMSIRNDICKMLFNKDYYKGNEGTWDLAGGIGGLAHHTVEVENPILNDDGTITIKSTFYDENKNIASINTLCIKEVNENQFRIIYVKK